MLFRHCVLINEKTIIINFFDSAKGLTTSRNIEKEGKTDWKLYHEQDSWGKNMGKIYLRARRMKENNREKT